GYENDTWMFTVFGMAGVEPPSELAEMLPFVDGLAPAHVLAAISMGEPVVEVRQDAPVPRRSSGSRRRDMQLQPDLWPGHDSSRPTGEGIERVFASRDDRPGQPLLPGRRETDRSRLAIRGRW